MSDVKVDDCQILHGDALDRLGDVDDNSVHTCVTSPPYWGLRDYGNDDQLGLEPSPGEYVASLVAIFRDVRRVLRPDGTLWLNLGDSYATSGTRQGDQDGTIGAENEHRSPGRDRAGRGVH
jgi:DNA modification methylase